MLEGKIGLLILCPGPDLLVRKCEASSHNDVGCRGLKGLGPGKEARPQRQHRAPVQELPMDGVSLLPLPLASNEAFSNVLFFPNPLFFPPFRNMSIKFILKACRKN